MKGNKQFGAALLMLLVFLYAHLPVSAETAVETEREVSLSIRGIWNGIALSGAEFAVFRVAGIEAGGELTVLPDYTKLRDPLQIRGEDAQSWQSAAFLTEQYILKEKITPTARGTTSQKGTVTFSGIPQGLYLVPGIRHRQDGQMYSTNPFFVQLPARDPETHTWRYQEDANAKPERTEETVSLQIVKQWRDKFHSDRRPEKIRLTLYRDGEKDREITLPQNGRWYCTLEGLDAGHTWFVEEEKVPGYETGITREGDVLLITNTLKESTPASELPQTGMLWWPVPWLLALGTGLVLVGLIRRRRGNA